MGRRGITAALLGLLTGFSALAQGAPLPSEIASGVSVSPPAQVVSQQTRGLSPVTVALIIVAVAAVALGAFVIIKRRDKKDSGNSTTAYVLPAAQSEQITEQMPAPLAVPLVGTVSNIGKRSTQEDAFGLTPLVDCATVSSRGVLAVVADGMGGLESGEEISGFTVSQLMKLFPGATAADGAELLLRLFNSVNNEVNNRFGGDRKMGTTLVMALIHDAKLYYLSVGDSRIGLIRSGAMIQLNHRHTYGAELDEQAARGLISFEEARDNPKRVAVTNFIGMGVIDRIDRNASPIELLSGDKIVLMTDGVFNTLDDHTIVELLTPGAARGVRSLGEAVLAREQKYQDNFTAIVLEV